MLPLSRGNDSKGTRSPRAVGTGTRALGGQSRSATQKLDHHEIASSPTFGTIALPFAATTLLTAIIFLCY